MSLSLTLDLSALADAGTYPIDPSTFRFLRIDRSLRFFVYDPILHTAITNQGKHAEVTIADGRGTITATVVIDSLGGLSFQNPLPVGLEPFMFQIEYTVDDIHGNAGPYNHVTISHNMGAL